MRKIFGDTLTEHFPAKKCTPRARARSCSPYVARKKEIFTPLRRNPKRSARSYYSRDVESRSEASDDDITSKNRLIVHWVGPLTKKRRISGKYAIMSRPYLVILLCLMPGNFSHQAESIGVHISRANTPPPPPPPPPPPRPPRKNSDQYFVMEILYLRICFKCSGFVCD